MSRWLWVGGLALGAVGIGAGIALLGSPKKKAAASKPRILQGHGYNFVAMNEGKWPKANLITALESVGWQHPVIYFVGDPYLPPGIVWPPVADTAILYAARATWGGASQEVPAGIIQLIDRGSEAVGATATDRESPWHAWRQDRSGNYDAEEMYSGPSEDAARAESMKWLMAGLRAGYYQE